MPPLDRRLLRGPLLALALSCAAGGCAGGDGSADEVVVYTALDRQFSEPIFAEFTRRTGIAVRAAYDTESTKTLGLAQRIRSERGRPRCDVFWNNEILQTLILASEGLVEPTRPAAAAAFPARWRAPDGTWHGFAARARVLLVNNELVPEGERPRGLEDLASPRWRGRVAIAKPLFGTTSSHVACLVALLGEDATRELLVRWKENAVQIHGGNKGCAVAVGRGEAAIALTDTDDAIAEVEAGRPVSIVYPDAGEGGIGTLFLPNTVALIRNAPRPEAGRRLIEFLLSEEVEDRLAKGPSAQIPLRDGAAPARVKGPADTRPMAVDFARAAALFATARAIVEEHFLE